MKAQPQFINRESATAQALYIVDRLQRGAKHRAWNLLERIRVRLYEAGTDLWTSDEVSR